MPFKVTYENSAGVLDTRDADDEEGAREAAIELLRVIAMVADGDLIRIKEIEQ